MERRVFTRDNLWENMLRSRDLERIVFLQVEVGGRDQVEVLKCFIHKQSARFTKCFDFPGGWARCLHWCPGPWFWRLIRREQLPKSHRKAFLWSSWHLPRCQTSPSPWAALKVCLKVKLSLQVTKHKNPANTTKIQSKTTRKKQKNKR